jgi:hypothetical protein
MVLNAAWRYLVVLGGAGGAWWYMAVQCALFVLLGAVQWRLVALGGAWCCCVSGSC